MRSMNFDILLKSLSEDKTEQSWKGQLTNKEGETTVAFSHSSACSCQAFCDVILPFCFTSEGAKTTNLPNEAVNRLAMFLTGFRQTRGKYSTTQAALASVL